MSAANASPSPGRVDTDSVPALGKRERNKLDKQRRIVAAASELFQQNGFEETTTAEIANRAGIGAGTLYLYVDSKEALLVSVFEIVAGDAWNLAFERIDRARPLVDQVTALFGHVTDHHEADLRLARSFFKELPWLDESERSGADEFVGAFVARIELLLDEASAAGRLDAAVPTSTLARNLYALWLRSMQRRVSGRQSYESTIAELAAAVQLALWKMTPETH